MMSTTTPITAPRITPRKPERAAPEKKAEAVSPAVANLDQVSLDGLREMAGVKKPGFFRRMINTATGWLNGINLALAIGPTAGHLILAKQYSSLQSAFTGEKPLAPMDWLRENRPKGFSASVASVMAAGSGPLQSAMGLSLTDLSEVEEHYYRAMEPSLNEEGVKSTAPFLRELAKEPYRGPGQTRSAFVFLGRDRQEEAKSVTDLWNRDQRPPENPFLPEDQRHRIWESLTSQASKGSLPIFVDIDGDFNSFTGTEFVAKKTLSSLGERNNSLGDDFADTGRYFAWLTQRLESYSEDLSPYITQKNPEAAAEIVKIKADLTPPWLDGVDGMGPWTAPDRMRTIPGRLGEIKNKHGQTAWLDSLISLDRDVLTGVQTHWIKLLRELKTEQREQLVAPLPGEFFRLNLLQPSDEGFAQVAPPDGPGLSEVVPQQNLVTKQRPYDRSVSLKELLDHTLDGLGIEERRNLLSSIRTQAHQSLPALEQRESQLRSALGEQYSGIDLRSLIDGKMTRSDQSKAVRQLLDYSDQNPRTETGLLARRHACIADFLHAMDYRYGEVEDVMHRIEGDFSTHPLGVSEYFIPPAPGAKVSPLKKSEPISVRLGNSQDPEPMKLSLVLEGGGGRGFAYPEALKQLESGFANSANGYEIDEYIGTSAGSLVAVLLAAGFETKELREVMETIDFTSFNADAAWLMGGVDPKVRGINRTGIFSTQKMYQTFHKLLSDKLGVEGRPVVFSDLPHKLKMVTGLMNTDLPDNDSLREHIDGDGRFVFSSDTTPNFDVAGALVASAAVPGFFQLPQVLVARPTEDGEVERSRMQFTDGGVLDNLSISSAGRKEKERALMVIPTHTQARDPETGEWVGLDTLNFSTDNLELVDAHNKKLFSKFVPKLDEYFHRLEEHGAGRAVIGFNLTKPWDQALPAVQGSNEALSLRSVIHAKDLGMPVLEKEEGDDLIKFTQRPPSLLTNSAANLFDRYIDDRPRRGDGEGDLHRTEDGYHFHPGKKELPDVFDMGWAAGGAALSASKSEYASRKFEQDSAS